MDEFIHIQLSRQTLARYTIRRGIKRAIDECMAYFSGDILDVGCGKMPYRRYIKQHGKITSYTGIDLEDGLDYDDQVKPDLRWDGSTFPLDDESFDTVVLTEVLEHVEDPHQLLNEVYRILRPEGQIMFTVPFVWNLHETPHDYYRYTPFALEKIFNRNKFTTVLMKPTGGWHASMAQFFGLWVARSGIEGLGKKWLQKLAIYIIPKLLKKDESAPVTFKEGQMITGIFGVIKKN